MVDQKLLFHLCLLLLLSLSLSLPLSLSLVPFSLSHVQTRNEGGALTFSRTAQRKPSSSNRNLCVLPRETHLFSRGRPQASPRVLSEGDETGRPLHVLVIICAFAIPGCKRPLIPAKGPPVRMCSRMVSDPTNVNGRTRHSVGHIVHFVQQDKLLCTLCDTRV